MSQVSIWRCANKHYSLQGSTRICRICGAPIVEEVEYRDGDCVACSALCPGYAYACDESSPISEDELEVARNVVTSDGDGSSC
jgi:hypothetical protein